MPTSTPLIAATSVGPGKKLTTESRRGCTPLFLKAEPHKIGTKADLTVPLRIHAINVSSFGSFPSKYSSIALSSCSTATSIKVSRYFNAVSFSSDGISAYSYSAPSVSSFQITALNFIRSTTPTKSDSDPIGSWVINGEAPKRSVIMPTQRSKLAPTRSILFIKQMRGTTYLSACRHTVSD